MLRALYRLPKLARPLSMATESKVSHEGGPVQVAIHTKLTALLQPSELTVTNDSWQHRHHAAMRGQGGGDGETHFSVNIVSDAFVGKTTMQRHRIIYSALSDEFASGLHALSLNTKTSKEVAQVQAS